MATIRKFIGALIAMAKKNTKRPAMAVQSVFEAISKFGHDEDFVPVGGKDFEPTTAAAGSDEKIELLRMRAEAGLPLWHPEDRNDFSGFTGGVKPRN